MSNNVSMTKLLNADISSATQLLFQAFHQDPMMLWLFGDAEIYNSKAPYIFSLWLKWCLSYGVAIKSEEMQAISLWKFPQHHHLSFPALLRSGLLYTHKILGSTFFYRLQVLNTLLTTEQVKQVGSDRFWYCWMIATAPAFRGHHYAEALMNSVHQFAADQHLPCYLEATTDAVVSFYQRLGYRVVSIITLPESTVKLYPMRRE